MQTQLAVAVATAKAVAAPWLWGSVGGAASSTQLERKRGPVTPSPLGTSLPAVG